MRSGPRRRVVTASIFLLYAVSVAAVTVVPHVQPPWARWDAPWWIAVQWVPFRVETWSFVLNVVMFVPLGVLAPLLWRGVDSWRRVAALSLALSAGIESVQLLLWVTLGSFRTVDVNDLIANTAGGLAGLVLLRAVRTRSRPGCSPRV